MYSIPPGDKIVEIKKCLLSDQEFSITEKDVLFYEKMSPVFAGKKYQIPTPTLSPRERMRRRLSFLNSRHLYNAKSSKTGKAILSIFSEDKGFQVYHFDEWYASDWDACDFGQKLDFTKTMKEGYGKLLQAFPKRNIVLGNGSENCEYVCGVGGSKNCYLISETSGATDCYFGNKVDNCEKCVDCSYCMKCILCYECIQCESCYGCSYCRDCSDCRDSMGLRDCHNVTDCIFSSNIHGKRFVFFNQQLSEDEYKRRLREFRMALNSGKINGGDVIEKIPKNILPHLHGENNENCLGDYLSHCSDCFMCFSCSECVNCRYCTSLIHDAKDCMDVDGVGNHIENIYESATINKNCSQIAFSNDCWGGCRDIYYSSVVKGGKNIFLSTGTINKENCILNSPYSLHEYETLCGKIIDHMRSTGEWGEFFPHELSPFGYNESSANEYFPLSKEAVASRGWNWYDGENKNTYIGPFHIPSMIDQYDEKIVGYEKAQRNIEALLSGIVQCTQTGKPFKIIRQELAFYIEHSIPIPKKHPEARYMSRMGLRNPRHLNEKKCTACGAITVTTSPLERSEHIVCEECYRRLVY